MDNINDRDRSNSFISDWIFYTYSKNVVKESHEKIKLPANIKYSVDGNNNCYFFSSYGNTNEAVDIKNGKC